MSTETVHSTPVAQFPQQATMFELPKFKPRGFAVALTSANNIPISEAEAERLKDVVMNNEATGDETLLGANVAFTVKGVKVEYGKLTFSLVVGDFSLDL